MTPTETGDQGLDPTSAWDQGWYRDARRLDSPNFGPRPPGLAVDLVVLHSISLPPGDYGGPAVQQLFTNTLDWDAHPYFQQIRGLTVSAHFFVRRDGRLWQFVSCDARAWHAGASCHQGRDNCNDFSIGIELEGLEGERFEPAQYARGGGPVRGDPPPTTRFARWPATSMWHRGASSIQAPGSTGRCCASRWTGVQIFFRRRCKKIDGCSAVKSAPAMGEHLLSVPGGDRRDAGFMRLSAPKRGAGRMNPGFQSAFPMLQGMAPGRDRMPSPGHRPEAGKCCAAGWPWPARYTTGSGL